MTILFVSDLHCEAGREGIGDQFCQFLRTEARDADALYILGDLFESWIGDDDPNPHYARIKDGLSALTRTGVPVYFMHGNRDFMIGPAFAADTGVRLLPDPLIADLYGERVLLSHGDAWCTDDHEYQALRRMTRDPQWQAMILGKSLAERQAIAAQARAESKARSAMKADEIMDVNAAAIAEAFRSSGVSTILHGHTHRPAMHELEVDGRRCRRIVLGDWYEQGSVLRWAPDGPGLAVLERG
ncbi:MAG: UDP-2,3-diacylglucosamine diphosphatase [Gammaproteobacteria bacterium]|nr:UDP-2,3-diacylglucosamine diphosphatase [Gammaproteobacteria bacterium]MDH4254240.1 UDP-2,3-diacylglucosamine diphosphatase [Gammaproteobacteria bacterium]MDH5311402.1 UDP-2,3-diacylglucosamine diphosphatase [Gammaproteobacteria bacterium]